MKMLVSSVFFWKLMFWTSSRFGRLIPILLHGGFSAAELLLRAWISCMVGLRGTSTTAFSLVGEEWFIKWEANLWSKLRKPIMHHASHHNLIDKVWSDMVQIRGMPWKDLLVHLRPSHEFHPSIAVHLPVETVLEEGVKNVRLQHLQTHQHQTFTEPLLPTPVEKKLSFVWVSSNRLVEKLLSRLSGPQELFTVEHSMLVVQMTADVPVHQTPFIEMLTAETLIMTEENRLKMIRGFTWRCWPAVPARSFGFGGWGSAARLASAPAARWCRCSWPGGTDAGRSESSGRDTCKRAQTK